MPFDVVYVSPHSDDVAFSAAAQLARDVAGGARVGLLTLFAPPDGAAHFGDASARRAEDQAFAGLVGAELLEGSLPDAAVRHPRYRSTRHLFGPLAPAESDLVAQARARIQAVVDAGCRSIVAPLAVGAHVDHQIAHAAAHAVDGAATRRFYEDTPYVLAKFQLGRRLAQLGRRPLVSPSGRVGSDETIGRGSRFAEACAAWRFWARAPLVAELAGGLARPFALAALAAPALLRPVEHHAALLGAQGCAATATRVEGDDVCPLKLRAIACYPSQWPLFFPTLAGWQTALEAYGRALGAGGAIERSWHLEGDPP